MGKAVSWSTMLALAIGLIAISFCRPDLLSDTRNGFFGSFINHQLLAFLGVVVTITLASAANLHLELNKLEDRTDRKFPGTRRAIKLSAYSLILLLVLGFVIVATKPFVSGDHLLSSLWNSSAILVVVFNVFVLTDLTITVLHIPSVSDVKKMQTEGQTGCGQD